MELLVLRVFKCIDDKKLKCYHTNVIEREKFMMKRLFISLVLILFILMGMTEVVHVSAGITIDGKFDDWKNQPVEKWTTDQFTYHDVGFVADDQYVYVYVSMAPKNPGNYKVMQPSGYQISINNHTYDLTLHLNDKLWSLQPGEGGRFSADVWNRTKNRDTSLNNAGYLLREKEADGRGNDVMEVAIPISTFGDDLNQSSTFTLKNPNLGQKEITTSGASTGPFILAGIGALLAAGGLVLYRRREKQELVNEN